VFVMVWLWIYRYNWLYNFKFWWWYENEKCYILYWYSIKTEGNEFLSNNLWDVSKKIFSKKKNIKWTKDYLQFWQNNVGSVTLRQQFPHYIDQWINKTTVLHALIYICFFCKESSHQRIPFYLLYTAYSFQCYSFQKENANGVSS